MIPNKAQNYTLPYQLRHWVILMLNIYLFECSNFLKLILFLVYYLFSPQYD